MAGENGLHIIIVGCGKVGRTLVEQLVQEGHDITVIDKNAQKAQSLAETYDILGIQGNGASYQVLADAGIRNADLFIAVTDADELNLLCCTVARREGNCAAIARVRSPEYSTDAEFLCSRLGLAMIINPELETAREAARILYLPSALEVDSFAHGKAEMVKFKIPRGSRLDGVSIMQLSSRVNTKVLICAVERSGEVYIPDGSFELKAGDVISIVATRQLAVSFLKEIDIETTKVHDAMIVGGGRSGYYLARQLARMGIRVKIIEKNPDRCEELSVLLPKAEIINGDGALEEVLQENGITEAEAFVALTGIDEENVLLNLYVRRVSKAKVITKITRSNFKKILSEMDLGSVVYPRYITAEAIIAYVRGKKNSMNANKVETLYHLFDHRVEAIEFLVTEPSAVTGRPLRELKLKKDLLISFILRNGRVLFPAGSDTIEVGDSVMLVTKHKGFNDLTNILA